MVGLALYVDPDFKLIRGAYPYIADQIMNSPNPDMRELLKRVVCTKDGRLNWKRLEQLLTVSRYSCLHDMCTPGPGQWE